MREGMRMRKWIVAVLALAILAYVFVPQVMFAEDEDAIRLAKTIYALGKGETYETKLALGTVVMNRVGNRRFADTVQEVLADQQQFPAGSRYDDESIRAARDVLSGKRTLMPTALYYQAADASRVWSPENRLCSVGNYNFYDTNGNI